MFCRLILKIMSFFLPHLYFFVISFGFAAYFKVSLASNALQRKANSFTLAKSKFSRYLMEKSDFFLCHMDNMSAVDSTLFLPFFFSNVPFLPSGLRVVMTIFSYRLINNISDLLFHHINADCIYSSDLNDQELSLQINCQIQYSISETYHHETVFLPNL